MMSTWILLALSACIEEELPVTTETALDCPEDTGYAPAQQPIQDLLADFAPVVVSSLPQAGDKAVSPGLTRITVTFSKDMDTQGFSWVTVPSGTFPEVDNPSFIDKRTARLEVTLEPDTTYALGTNGGEYLNFRDSNGTPALPWQLVFHTAPE